MESLGVKERGLSAPDEGRMVRAQSWRCFGGAKAIKDRSKNYAWVRNCPICSQGRLIVARDLETDAFFILCEECDSAWESPEDSSDIGKTSLVEHSKADLLERDSLVGHPWQKYLHG